MGKTIWLVASLIVGLILVSGCVGINSDEQAKARIRIDLIGADIVYTNIAGESMIYAVTNADIKSIEKTTLANQTVWKVRVGEALAWDIYYDETGSKVVKQEQLFKS